MKQNNRPQLRPLTLALTLALTTAMFVGCSPQSAQIAEEKAKLSQRRYTPEELRQEQNTPAQTEISAAVAYAEADKSIAAADSSARAEPKPSPSTNAAPAKEQDSEETLDSVEVTGTRIKRTDMETASPVVQIAPSAVGATMPKPVIVAAAPEPELVVDTENYDDTAINPIKMAATEPVSTFSVDVDTGSYTNTRRMLTQENRLPPHDAVRPEEFINYFDYAYKQPANRSQPFSVTTELGAAPWNPKHELLMVGLQGYEMQKSEIPPANLVFLLDVSGSMDEPNKLPLLKASMTELVERLSARDFVSIVVYAGAAGVVLEPTRGDQREKILGALNRLSAGGSTNGGEGIELAYKLAAQNKIEGGVNRILLATDGDFNVGQFDQNKLKEFVSGKRETGVTLSTFGFGAGNYNDAMAEQLADAGNGKYTYIDSIEEAKRVLGKEIAGSLYTIASDVKIQIEFNPKVVAEYRLIGYDNRMLAREDFNNDKVDAGDIGVGHRVTALYEIARVGSGGEAIDPLRYTTSANTHGGAELGFLKLRYKLPNQTKSVMISQVISAKPDASYRLQYAAMVAAFAEHLRGGKYLGEFGLAQIESAVSNLPKLSSSDLPELVGLAKQIEGPAKPVEIAGQ